MPNTLQAHSKCVESVCENCGEVGLEKFIDQPDQQLLRCPQCDLYQKGVLDSPLVYEEEYHDEYERRLASKQATAAIRLGSIKPYLDCDYPRMLDIGCSVGATVAAANSLGWIASGVDISHKAVAICQERGLDCEAITGVELPFPDNYFDVVTNWHVIEHVHDVHETLNEWSRILKPGGVMILETPDSSFLKARVLGPRYKKFWPAEHLYTFNRTNLESILSSSGFEILPGRVIGGWNALPPSLTTYAIAYRSLRNVYRSLKLCKSIEICCRKRETIAPAISRAAA